MADNEDNNIRKTFDVLKSAKSDNEKFAAFLLFAKTTEGKELSLPQRKMALEYIGMSFFNRLLKSESVPDECPVNIYKGLALKILSGLCGDKQLMLEFEVYKNLRYINDIITDTSSEIDMITDCYDLLTVLTQTEEGCLRLVDYGTITALSEVITKHVHGCERAQCILQSALYLCGHYAWKKDAPSMHIIMEYFCKQLETFQDERKFELCSVVSGLLSSVSTEIGKKSLHRSWFTSLLHAMNDIFTSKLGEPQRDPALKLGSIVLSAMGVESILPPNREDCKLLLVIIHLSCIEIRITLENLASEQILRKVDTLVSCYNVLELVICYMTSSPSLQLDENQVLQLHSAMEGAFNSIVFYLREQSEHGDQVEDPNQVVLASVRVLGSWLAEETSALKARVQEILPFLVKLCKCQVDCSLSDKPRKKKKSVRFDTDTVDESLSAKLECCGIDMETEKGQEDHCDSNTDSCHSKSSANDCVDSKEVCSCPVSQTNETQGKHSNSSKICSLENESDIYKKHITDNISSNSSIGSDITIVNVDCIQFLLPGLCHMTAEDTSRKILLDNDLQSSLSVYFSKCVNLLSDDLDEDILRSMETLCGVFLNLVVLEPELVAENEDLHKVTQNIFKCAIVICNKENVLTLWSNVITLGVFFLRQQSHCKYDKDELTKFFSMVVSFIKAPYTSETIDGVDVLSVTETYRPVWDSIYQLWYLCAQASTSCLPMYQSLVYAMMSTGFLPHIIRLLNRVQGRNVDEDTLLCLIGVITSLVTTEPKAKDVFISCGGLDFSRTYNCSELEKLVEQ